MRKTIEVEDPEVTRTLLGTGDCHLKRVRDALGVGVVVRKYHIHLDGADTSVSQGVRIFTDLLDLIRQGHALESLDVERILDSVLGPARPSHASVLEEPSSPAAERLLIPGAPDHGHERSWSAVGAGLVAGRVKAMTEGQARYLEAIRSHDVVFSIGPAGSGKTYLAVAMAMEALLKHLVHRLILVRPAVEAGEHLGFLPGDLREKVNPYLRPLYDALHDMVNPQQVQRFLERGVIEIAPLAFMRGRTLNNAFVILDEAQNTTPKQMKMFLTRLGRDARAVITGDVTQVDLPDSDLSGLAHAREVLNCIDGVAFIHLDREDIVRHPLVQRIVDAYEEREAKDHAEAAPLRGPAFGGRRTKK